MKDYKNAALNSIERTVIAKLENELPGSDRWLRLSEIYVKLQMNKQLKRISHRLDEIQRNGLPVEKV